MIVGLDYRPALWSRVGISRHVRELVAAFEEHLTVEDGLSLKLYGDCLRRTRHDPADPPTGFSPYVELFAKRLPARLSLWKLKRGRGDLRKRLGAMDVFHHTDYVEPLVQDTPLAVSIYDLAFFSDESHHGPERARLLTEVTRRLVAEARVIITPSQFTAAEVAIHLGIHPDQIHIVPLGADHALRIASSIERPDVEDPPFILTLGTLEPRKNHLRCLKVFERLCGEGLDISWRIIGSPGWLHEPFLEALDQSRFRDRIKLQTKGIREAHVFQALRAAKLLLYPSLVEGFGLPVVEAMALGTPVVTSSVSALAEVAGTAAMLVDPRQEDSIHAGVKKLLDSPELRVELEDLGREKAREYTWERTAALTVKAYHSALQPPRRNELSRLF